MQTASQQPCYFKCCYNHPSSRVNIHLSLCEGQWKLPHNKPVTSNAAIIIHLHEGTFICLCEGQCKLPHNKSASSMQLHTSIYNRLHPSVQWGSVQIASQEACYFNHITTILFLQCCYIYQTMTSICLHLSNWESRKNCLPNAVTSYHLKELTFIRLCEGRCQGQCKLPHNRLGSLMLLHQSIYRRLHSSLYARVCANCLTTRLPPNATITFHLQEVPSICLCEGQCKLPHNKPVTSLLLYSSICKRFILSHPCNKQPEARSWNMFDWES